MAAGPEKPVVNHLRQLIEMLSHIQPYYELILDTDTALWLIIAQFPERLQESYAFLSPAGTVYPSPEIKTKF